MPASSLLRPSFTLHLRRPQFLAPLVALLLLVVVNVVSTRNFGALSNVWNILVQVAPTMLVAVGMSFVIATGGIDLSVGSLMAIASAVTATNLAHGALPAILMGLGLTLVIGAINGTLIAKLRVQPIIVTLAVLIGGRGAAQVISEGGRLIPIDNASFEQLGRGRLGPFPIQVVVVIGVVLAGGVILRLTVLGRYVLAVGENEKAAALSGVPVAATKIVAYGISGVLAGLAGLIETARLGASDASRVGLNMELDAIAAVVVGGTLLTGGTATVIGTVLGTLIIQVITTSLNMLLVPYAWSLVLKAAVILVVVYIQGLRPS
jgi:ribose/xylose/arabinose/galactoside ABC-type transport system permease subunit